MATPDPRSLRQRALRAGGWSFLGYGMGQALRLGSNLVMTRLLVPEMFGVMAIATMVGVILYMLSDLGIHQNIIQSKRGDDPRFLDTAWVVQIFRGAMLWTMALGVCAALYLANKAGFVPAHSVYAAPELPLVLAVTSFSALLFGLESTRMATAHRGFEQKRIIQIALLAQVVALAVMMVAGYLTRSIWALVAGGVVASLTSTLLSHTWMKGHPNRFRVEKAALGELMGFGKWIIVSSVLSVLAANGDRLILGGIIDVRVLGVYSIAALIAAAIEGAMGRLVVSVGLPALSEIARNEPSRLREVYYKIRIPGDLMMLFVAGLLYASGQLLIDFLYDARYAEAGGMLQILGFSLIAVRYRIAHQMYLALGKPRYLALINVVRCVALFTLLPILYYIGGLHAALWGIALHALTTVPLIHYYNAGLGLNDYRRELVVLLALPAGYLCGTVLNMVLGK
jgi:O-antigen/teichoic acid export membrane protein